MYEIVRCIGLISLVYVFGAAGTLLVLVTIDEVNDVWMPNWAILLCVAVWPVTLVLLFLKAIVSIYQLIHMLWCLRRARKVCDRINDRNIERRSYGGDPT